MVLDDQRLLGFHDDQSDMDAMIQLIRQKSGEPLWDD